MSALARFFLSRGKEVSGYDKTSTVLTKMLETEGANIVYEDDAAFASRGVDLVVYTPAVKEGSILTFYRSGNYTIKKRSEVLGIICSSGYSICVAGTHGKTSISSMIAHLLRDSGYGCNAFLGGIAANYQTNYWSHERNVFVVEADEYDRSFLQLKPNVAIVSSTDPDHLDIYEDAERFSNAFNQFVSSVHSDGLLVLQHGVKALANQSNTRSITYAINRNMEATLYSTNLMLQDRGFVFDVSGSVDFSNMYMPVGGLHNVENMIAAIAVADYLGIAKELIRQAVASYNGVQRRFQYHCGGLINDPFTYIDDYAHHPTELRALLTSVKERFSGKPVTIVFQPHLYSRTRDFADGFAEVLAVADVVLLLPIYPARELPIPGVSSEMIAEKIKHTKVRCIGADELLKHLDEQTPEVLLTAGAGDIDLLVPQIVKWYQQKVVGIE